ncbi:MAG: START-like domain-containing protein [Ginsengibacter sp.]
MSKKVKYTVEYPVRCSPGILYEFLSTSSGLQEWFADKVEDSDGHFKFSWSGSTHSENAQVLEKEENKFIRFQWDGSPENEYFEFSIEKSEVTNQTILVIHDFADKKEIKDQSQLWESQVKDLFHRIGGN